MENTRICKNCSKEVIYKTRITYLQACKRDSVCKSCRTTIANKSPNRKIKKSDNPAWKGYEEIPFGWFSRYFLRKENPHRKSHTGDITIEQVHALWLKQNRRCALTGLNIGWYVNDTSEITCSIDRIDSNYEYTLDNIQLVHKDINLMKNKFDNQYFIDMCKLIAKNNDGGQCAVE